MNQSPTPNNITNPNANSAWDTLKEETTHMNNQETINHNTSDTNTAKLSPEMREVLKKDIERTIKDYEEGKIDASPEYIDFCKKVLNMKDVE